MSKGQPLDSFIITLLFQLFLSNSISLVRNDENNPRHRPRKKERPGKVLGKIMRSNYKNVYMKNLVSVFIIVMKYI